MFSVIVFVLMFTLGSSSQRNTACSLEFSLIGTKCYHFSSNAKKWDGAFHDCLGKKIPLPILSNPTRSRAIHLITFLRGHGHTSGIKNRPVIERKKMKFGLKKKREVWTGAREESKILPKSLIKNKRLLQWKCIKIMDSSRNKIRTFQRCFQRDRYFCRKLEKRPTRIGKICKNKICKRSASEINENQKEKCLKVVGGYEGKQSPNIPTPIIQTPKPTTNHMKEYICPSNMFVVENKCYYFSQDALNWNDAHWACQNKKMYLAVVLNRVQDKLLREFLTKEFVEKHERWLGGLYYLKQKRWMWANSGYPLKYDGFPFKNYTGKQFEWRGITIDPNIGNMWNSRLMIERKHYICQHEAKTITKLGDFHTDRNNHQEKFVQISANATKSMME